MLGCRMRDAADFTLTKHSACYTRVLHISQPLEAMQVEEIASLALATGDSYTQLISLSRHLLVSFALVSLDAHVDYSTARCALVEHWSSSCFGAWVLMRCTLVSCSHFSVSMGLAWRDLFIGAMAKRVPWPLVDACQCTLYCSYGLDVQSWLTSATPQSKTSYLISVPISMPLISLIQLIQFLIVAWVSGLSLAELHQSLTGTAGHS